MTRICPKPIPWNNVFKRLSSFAEDCPKLSRPPAPLILNGWVYTNDTEKIVRWKETVAWAKDAGCEAVIEALSDEDFYFSDEVTTYEIGPLGGPMYRSWDFEAKERPAQTALDDALQLLKARWPDVARGFSDATQPVGFSGAKCRRLLVAVSGNVNPPWGEWNRFSVVEDERRTFTAFRRAVNNLLAPIEVDHIDFKVEA